MTFSSSFKNIALEKNELKRCQPNCFHITLKFPVSQNIKGRIPNMMAVKYLNI